MNETRDPRAESTSDESAGKTRQKIGQDTEDVSIDGDAPTKYPIAQRIEKHSKLLDKLAGVELTGTAVSLTVKRPKKMGEH